MIKKTVVITGASDGIGAAAARLLKERGMQVVIVGRNPNKTRQVADELSVPYEIADFSMLSDVRMLAKTLLEKYQTIDVLVNNAGGIFGDYTNTVDGYELTFQVNHLAHFLLTNLLLDRLIASRATVISTSSIANKRFSSFDIDNLNLASGYSANRAYGNAKLANILFTRELDRRYGARGISAVSFHPGIVKTGFAAESRGILHALYQSPLKRLMRFISPEEGADTLVWLATTHPGQDWELGEHYYMRHVATSSMLADVANNQSIAARLWDESVTMVSSQKKRA